MKALFSVIGFAVRHFWFVSFVMAAGLLLWTVAYVALLLFAMVAGGGLGGPLAYPAGITMVIVTCVVAGWGIFAPAAGIGRVFCRISGLPGIAAIPVVVGSAFCLSYFLYRVFIEEMTTHPTPPAGTVLKYFLIYISVPLGVHWWLTEGPGAVFDVFRRWLRSRGPGPREKFGCPRGARFNENGR